MFWCSSAWEFLYSKTSLIRFNGCRGIRIKETKDSPKRQKGLTIQINGKFNNIGNSDGNKEIKILM
jgi:hypothetical protein